MSTPKKSANNKRGQFADDSIYFPGDDVQNHVYWHPFGDAGFVKSYCEYKAHILIRFRVGDGQDFIACVQRDWEFCPVSKLKMKYSALSGGEIEHSCGEVKRDVIWAEGPMNRYLLWRKAMRELRYASGQEKPVLVDIVELMEGPKREIPSLIWLDTVENFESLLVDFWYASSERGFVSLGRMSYGELGVPGDGWDYPTSDIIESAAKAMQNITSNQGNVRGNPWKFADVIDQFSGFRILLSESRERVSIVKDATSRVEFLEMLLGPVQFG